MHIVTLDKRRWDKASDRYYVYVLKNLAGKLYVGQTKNLENRLKSHNAGRVFPTKYGCPWELVHHEYYLTRREAMRREFSLRESVDKRRLFSFADGLRRC